MRNLILGMAAMALLPLLANSSLGGEPEKHTLRYKFRPNETIRWEVEHRSMVRATVSGKTQSTETLSNSVNVWRVTDVQSDGTTTFEHRVEWVDMRQTLTGRSEVHYDSRTGAEPPKGFEDAAKSVGVPLSIVKMDARGKVLHRERRQAKPQTDAPGLATQRESWLAVPLPEEPIAVGHKWSIPQDIDLPLPSGAVKKIKSVQQFTLEEVKTGVAVIRVSTDILTPITDPVIESQLVERAVSGTVRFDVDAGRILGQQMDVDKHVIGFRGDASSIHYVNRFSERLLPEPGRK